MPSPHWARGVTAAVLAASLPACFPPSPDPEVVACLQGCAREKDQCLVAATSSDGIQACDARSGACNAGCQP